jgi:hypothetical protein
MIISILNLSQDSNVDDESLRTVAAAAKMTEVQICNSVFRYTNLPRDKQF